MKKFATTKNTLAITAVVLTIAGAGVFGIARANAATDTTTNPMTSLVQEIATKFGLKQSDVQAVFDQHHTERQAQMEKKYEDHLTKLVTDGKITEQQKQLILAKHQELEASRQKDKQNFQNMTPEQRKAAREQERTDLENWAKQNNLDLKYLMPMGMGGRHGFGRPGMMSGSSTTQPTASVSPTTQTN